MRVVLRNCQNLIARRPESLAFADEIVPVDRSSTDIRLAQASRREKKERHFL